MQTQVIDRQEGVLEAGTPACEERSGRKMIVSTYSGVLVCVDMQRVAGCVQIEKLTRLPGSHERVAGILLFRGRPVPLLSVWRARGQSGHHKPRYEERALVVSLRGMEFAMRVDGVPTVVDGSLPYASSAGAKCVMREKHLERFLTLCVLSGDRTVESSGVPDCRGAV